MPLPKKLSVEFKIDSTSPINTFIEWYENTHRTINQDTGRKRKGDAKGTIKKYLEHLFSGTHKPDLDKFMKEVETFREDTKLPTELQKAKNTLSPTDYESFKSLYEKIGLEEKKNE